MPFPGDPRLRRARPRHGFTSPGYVENLPVREQVPVDWEKMRNKYIPWTIMNLISPQVFGTKALMGGMMTFPTTFGISSPYDLRDLRRGR